MPRTRRGSILYCLFLVTEVSTTYRGNVVTASFSLLNTCIMRQEQAQFGPYARRWMRLHVNIPIRVLVQKPDCLHIVNGRGTELSEGGVALYAAVELDIGDRVELEVADPESGPPIRAKAVVRNRAGYAYGLQFLLEGPPVAQ